MPRGMGTYGSMVGRPKKKKKMRDGGKSFPDLNKDGKITKADILMGRGVKPKKKMMDGGMMSMKKNMMSKKRDMMYGGGMMSRKRKMKGGGTVNQQSVNENINPYGRPADTSLT